MNKIKVGVVGVGYLGQFHAEKYAKTAGVELVGVVDIDPSRAREVAKRYHTQAFFCHSDLYDKVQAVSIAVPTPSHHGIAKDFLLHGIDILLEKPIATTLAEADELIQLAQSKGLILQVGHLERFNGALVAAQGKIRNPLLIESHRFGPFTERAANVNVVIDLMIHDIDVTLSLIQSKVKEIRAIGFPLLTPHLDFANARIEFENGSVANLMASRVSEERTRRAWIFQPDGTLTIDYLSQKAFFTRNVPSPEKGGVAEAITDEIPVHKTDALETEIRSFIESVTTRREARVSGWEGKQALEIALRIIEKIDEGIERRKTKRG